MCPLCYIFIYNKAKTNLFFKNFNLEFWPKKNVKIFYSDM